MTYDHGIGHRPRGATHARYVDRITLHGDPIDFPTLAARAIPADTRYLVLDLDRTTHRGRNLGELLGWELNAWHGYGPDHLDVAEARRPRGRFFIDRQRPLAAARYLLRAARVWAHPGLSYLLYDKIAPATARGRAARLRRFGPQPLAAIQRLPQTALLSQIAELPPGVAAALAARVWDRHAPDQVITRDDLDALRARIPGLVIVLSSASPRATVEHAAAALGVDDALWSTVDRADAGDRSTASYRQHRLNLLGAPDRISDPRAEVINAGATKIERLRARHPAMFAPGARVVGISDTGHGEDHPWAEHFARVIDVDSPDPYAPIVSAQSPLEEIHSATLSTRRERETGSSDPRRPRAARRRRSYDAGQLARVLDPTLTAIETHAAALAAAHARIAPELDALAARHAALIDQIAGTVAAYNAGDRRALGRLRAELRHEDALTRELGALTGDVARARHAIEALRADARRAIEPPPLPAARPVHAAPTSAPPAPSR